MCGGCCPGLSCRMGPRFLMAVTACPGPGGIQLQQLEVLSHRSWWVCYVLADGLTLLLPLCREIQTPKEKTRKWGDPVYWLSTQMYACKYRRE